MVSYIVVVKKEGFSKQGWFWFLVSATFCVLHFWSLTALQFFVDTCAALPEMVATMWLDHTPYTLTCVIPFGSTYFVNSSIPEISKRVHEVWLWSIIIRDRIEQLWKIQWRQLTNKALWLFSFSDFAGPIYCMILLDFIFLLN